MMYVLLRVEVRLDGSPTYIVHDEVWKGIDEDVIFRRIKNWEKTIRKLGGIVGFATQSAQDALESRIASAIIEQAATQTFMANPTARAADDVEGFGPPAHEFELVRRLPAREHCFFLKQANARVVTRKRLETGKGATVRVN